MGSTCVLGAYGVDLEKSIFDHFWTQWTPLGNSENPKFRELRWCKFRDFAIFERNLRRKSTQVA